MCFCRLKHLYVFDLWHTSTLHAASVDRKSIILSHCVYMDHTHGHHCVHSPRAYTRHQSSYIHTLSTHTEKKHPMSAYIIGIVSTHPAVYIRIWHYLLVCQPIIQTPLISSILSCWSIYNCWWINLPRTLSTAVSLRFLSCLLRPSSFLMMIISNSQMHPYANESPLHSSTSFKSAPSSFTRSTSRLITPTFYELGFG